VTVMTSLERVRQVKFNVVPDGSRYTLEVRDLETPSVIADVFGFNSWAHVKRVFECTVEQHGYADNGSGITFPHEVAEFGETLEGIRVYNPILELTFDEFAFNELAHRYLRATLLLAQRNQDPILRSQWGKVLQAYLSQQDQPIS
jgi:hypothetical protein